MKNFKRVLVVLVSLLMLVSVVGCSKSDDNNNEPQDNKVDTPLVVAYAEFNEKFSPFFSETAYDQDVYAMTQVGLLGNDRGGAIIMNGIQGETVSYNGTDYTYYGIADCKITENADGTVYYDFQLRDDVVFSDGEKLTADDVIFSYYVLLDPTYDGSSTLFALPIEGVKAYRSGMDTLFNLLIAAGKDNTDFTYWDEATQTQFWASVETAGGLFVQEIVDYLTALGYGADTNGAAMINWGFEEPADATNEEIFWDMVAAYGGDILTMTSTETAGTSLQGFMADYDSYTKGITTGESVDYVSGIQKTGDYSVRVVLTEVDATAIYQLGVSVAPLHYYGDAAQYDYNANKFGFPKGDLSSVKAVTTKPMGAGAYKFVEFKDGIVYFEANENYFQGCPKTKYVQFKQGSEGDKLNGVVTGTVDIADPSINKDVAAEIMKTNGNDSLTGDKITTNLVDNLGYGYIGMSAKAVNINGELGSEASKNLRKGIATILAVYRDVAISSYYGERAAVINYPISNTSWAAPQSTDPGYKVAFSTDVNGKEIYTADMSADQKYAAAKEAALGYFEAAGYTVADGKVTAAPAGAKMEWTAWIPADGNGDHPSFMIYTEAQKAFEEIGLKFNIKDLSNSSELWDAIEADQVDIWAAAWGATIDPDMYQIYHNGIEDGLAAGGSNYMYDIADAQLDKLIMDARASLDTSYRKILYKNCLDIIVDWAVEIPVYQRKNCVIFSTERVNMYTVTKDITTFYGWMSEIENLELN